MKLGILVAIYQGRDLLDEFFEGWLAARKIFDIKLCFIDGKFENFDGETQNSNDGTIEYLEEKLKNGEIDFLHKTDRPLKEHEARNIGVKYLLEQDCSWILTSAPDECFNLEQIKYIYNYLIDDEFTTFFRLNYNNYVGDKQHYIKGFCPKRIWRTNLTNYSFNGFRFDDDGQYCGKITRDIKKDDEFPSLVMPRVAIDHYCWLSDQRSLNKIKYQNSRKWVCSYIWDDKTNSVKFNPEFYKDKPFPKLHKINE